jgi:hypothetical protein
MWPWGVSVITPCATPRTSIKIASNVTTAYWTTFVPNRFGNGNLGSGADDLDYFQPMFKVPPRVLSADPAWKNCRLQSALPARRIVALTAEPTAVVETPKQPITTAAPHARVANTMPLQTTVPGG